MEQNKISLKLKEEVSEEIKNLISSLPSQKDLLDTKVSKYQGCWYYHHTLQGVINFQRGFEAQNSDIIVASFPKCGTTWLKALTFAISQRSKHCFDDNHPLLSNNPHDLVPYFEFDLYFYKQNPDLTKLSSPRLFSTHMPFHTFRENIKDSPCKIVYVWRNVKDTLVSYWYHYSQEKLFEIEEISLEDVVESFCSGVSFFGPFWDHIESYWRGSLEDPEHVLFMKYEEVKVDPHHQVKRLAKFLGCPFTEEEEKWGLVEKIVQLCSLGNLRSLEINKTGKLHYGIDNKIFFRKGEVGDWKNHLTPEMEHKIDMIIEEKFQSFGLKL